ncbi:MAG: site-2 protease family protein [Anaerolineae bacterium]|nr:site-2 protease family protein [Anaerolineae bacterium]MDW8171891.1 site-2 protease family protein [Anaerolineae bacterium]
MLLLGSLSFETLIMVVIIMLFSMGLHEYGHALMANWWGDPTPRSMGRLTPNPLVHINWLGFAMFVLIGFGILGSVPVQPRYMRDPRWGAFWTAFAGPLMNLAVAVAAAILFRVAVNIEILPPLFTQFIFLTIFFNLLLFLFNLLPFFPIDGWRMALALLPGVWLRREQIPAFVRFNMPPLSRFLQNPAYKWQDWAQISQAVLFVLIMMSFVLPSFNVLGALISGPLRGLMAFLTG